MPEDPATPEIQHPDEEGIEESVLRWLSGIPTLPKSLQWTEWNPEGGEGGALLDRKYDRDKNEVVYWDILREQLIEINDEVTEDNVDSLITTLRRQMSHDGLMAGNQAVHRLLLEGQQFEASHGNGTTKRTYARLIDFTDPEKNRFDAVSQMRVIRGHSVRPDITLLVNGLPVVQIELKSQAQDNDYTDAITDLREYEQGPAFLLSHPSQRRRRHARTPVWRRRRIGEILLSLVEGSGALPGGGQPDEAGDLCSP
jgi:type I restriction enzyme R subunit